MYHSWNCIRLFWKKIRSEKREGGCVSVLCLLLFLLKGWALRQTDLIQNLPVPLLTWYSILVFSVFDCPLPCHIECKLCLLEITLVWKLREERVGKTKACLNLLISLSTIYRRTFLFPAGINVVYATHAFWCVCRGRDEKSRSKKRTSWRGMANARHLFPLWWCCGVALLCITHMPYYSTALCFKDGLNGGGVSPAIYIAGIWWLILNS